MNVRRRRGISQPILRYVLAGCTAWTLAASTLLAVDLHDEMQHAETLAADAGTRTAAREHMLISVSAFSLLWLLGLGGIVAAGRRLDRRIAERTAAEQALRASEDRYRRIVETTLEGIWEIDAEGRTTFANRPMAEMLGTTVEEMRGRSMYDFMDERARAEAEGNLARRRERVIEQHDFRLRRSDGSDIWTIMSTNPVVDDAGAVVGALAVVTDISRRKEAEERLRQSEERLRLLIESTDDVVIMQDLTGRYLYCNPGPRYGVQGADVVGKWPRDFFDAATADQILREVRLVAEGGKPTTITEGLSWGGQHLWFQARRFPVRDSTGAVTAVSTFLRNVTEQRRAEQELLRAEERLRVERMRTQIAADLHDELGSTLSGISVFSTMLRRELPGLGSRAGNLVNRIEESVGLAQDSLHDIVWTINPANDSLDDLFLHMQEYAAEILEGRGIGFTAEIPEQPLPASLSMERRRQIQLVFREAITNLVRHSGCSNVHLRVSVEEGMLEVALRDDGRGFTAARPTAGNGIANMRARAGAIGGTLGIDSALGVGTTVTLRAPIA